MKYQPYKHWSKTEFSEHLRRLCNVFGMGKHVKELITEAVKSEAWDSTLDYDGCTIVQDMYHPCISCFLHDYLWRSGQGGKHSDALFYEIMLIEGMPIKKAKRRWFAVRTYWLFYKRWFYVSKRNLNEYSPAFEAALKYYKLDK